MSITEGLYSFSKPCLVACSPSCDPMTGSIVKGLLIFVALTGISAYYSLQFADFCSTLPQIELKPIDNILNVTHVIPANITSVLDDIEKMKTFINWFNRLEPYDICFYGAFGTASCLALTFSMAAISLFMLSHVELKIKPREVSRDRLFDCLRNKPKVDSQDCYSGLLSSSRMSER